MSTEIKNPQLKALAEQVMAARQLARVVVGGLARNQLDWQPAPGRWGVGQCVEHLIISNERMEEAIHPRLSLARSRGVAPRREEWKPSFMGGFLIRSVDPETGKRKVRTGRVFEPGPAARADLLAAFEKNLDLVMELIRQADEVDPVKVRVVSPMSWLVRYHLGDALTIMVVHLKRHLDQAERVKQESGFPAAM